jgi:hypothetical protein
MSSSAHGEMVDAAFAVRAGVSRRHWPAQSAASVPTVLRSSSFGGLSRCGCRAVPGNVGVRTSGRPSQQDSDFSSRARFARAWPRGGRLERGRCLAQRGRPTQRRMARQQPLALPCYKGKRRGSWHLAAAVGAAAASQLELLRPPAQVAAAAPSRITTSGPPRRPAGARSTLRCPNAAPPARMPLWK